MSSPDLAASAGLSASHHPKRQSLGVAKHSHLVPVGKALRRDDDGAAVSDRLRNRRLNVLDLDEELDHRWNARRGRPKAT